MTINKKPTKKEILTAVQEELGHLFKINPEQKEFLEQRIDKMVNGVCSTPLQQTFNIPDGIIEEFITFFKQEIIKVDKQGRLSKIFQEGNPATEAMLKQLITALYCFLEIIPFKSALDFILRLDFLIDDFIEQGIKKDSAIMEKLDDPEAFSKKIN